jgi:uncharacterized membrane protein YfhO
MPEDEILQFLKSDDFSPEKMVVFEKNGYELTDEINKNLPTGEYKVTEYYPEELHIRAITDRDCYIVMSEIYYPGWKAEVNGKSVPVLCGNYIFRAIPLEKGENVIRLYFVSWPFRTGLIISIFSLFSLLTFLLLSWRRGSVNSGSK